MNSIVAIALMAFLVWSGMKFMDVITDKERPASTTKKILVAIPPIGTIVILIVLACIGYLPEWFMSIANVILILS